MSAPQQLETTDATEDRAFAFVRALAEELSKGKVELPGFPDVAIRIQRVLADENVTPDRIVRVIGSEPVLAGRLLQMANSVALNVTGKPVTDLRTAVTRVGINIVRSATIAFAIQQLRRAPALRGLEKPLDVLWQRSVQVASLCHVIAKRLTHLSPDTAMLAGLLHGIGRLYILTRAGKHRALFSDVATYQAIEREWHLTIAVALLENWEIADEIVQAVRDSADMEREVRGSPCLGDVLMASMIIAQYQNNPAELEANLQKAKAVQRLQLTPAVCEQILREAAEEIAALRAALG